MVAEYTLHAPQRLTASVWLSPALVVNGWSLGAVRFVLLSRPVMTRPSKENVDGMLRWLLPQYALQHPAEFERSMVDHTAVAFQCFDTTQVGRGWGPRRFSASELRSIEVPVLYLAGVDERLCSSPAGAARLGKVAPQIQAALLPGAGHDLVFVHPEEVGRRILDFLGETTARARDGAPRSYPGSR